MTKSPRCQPILSIHWILSVLLPVWASCDADRVAERSTADDALALAPCGTGRTCTAGHQCIDRMSGRTACATGPCSVSSQCTDEHVCREGWCIDVAQPPEPDVCPSGSTEGLIGCAPGYAVHVAWRRPLCSVCERTSASDDGGVDGPLPADGGVVPDRLADRTPDASPPEGFLCGEAGRYSDRTNPKRYVDPTHGNDANNGMSWGNAFATLHALERGAIYFVADGDHPAVVLGAAERGGERIFVVRATADDHGSDAGFSLDMADGRAEFGNVTFSTGHWVFDGQQRTGWQSGYGFRVTNLSPSGKILRIDNASTDITLRYVDFENLRGAVPGESTDGIYAPSASDLTLQCSAVRDVGRTVLLLDGSRNVLIEHSYLARNASSPDAHGDGVRFWAADRGIIRYNRIEDIVGTGPIVLAWGNDHVDIYGNVILHTPGFAGAFGTGAIVDISEPGEIGVSNVRIYNNTFLGLRALNAGLLFQLRASDTIDVRNNIWFGCEAHQIGMINVTVHDFNAYGGNVLSSYPEPSEPNGQTLTADPFVDSATGDVHLRLPTEGGQGGLPPEFLVDPDGSTRGADGTVDRGAFEFVSE